MVAIVYGKRVKLPASYVSEGGHISLPAWHAIREALKDEPGIAFPRRRHRCGWGEWALVAASLEALRLAEHRFPLATHFYMLSGDCMPIKSAQYTHDFLDRVDCDYIEAVDFFDGGWIKTGIRKERLIYRHWFNERTQRKRFYAMFEAQKRLGLTRKIPADLRLHRGDPV